MFSVYNDGDHNMTTALKKKITVKDVIGKVIPALKKAGITEATDDEGSITGVIFPDNTPILRIIGQVTGFTSGESDYGPWVKFRGDFQGTNLLTGEVCRSRAWHVPDLIGDDIVAALKEADNTAVEVAGDITVSPMTSAQGYSYEVMPLVDVARDDPLERLKVLVDEKWPMAKLAPPEPEPVAVKQKPTPKAAPKKKTA
jgi:hypothetical protein